MIAFSSWLLHTFKIQLAEQAVVLAFACVSVFEGVMRLVLGVDVLLAVLKSLYR